MQVRLTSTTINKGMWSRQCVDNSYTRETVRTSSILRIFNSIHPGPSSQYVPLHTLGRRRHSGPSNHLYFQESGVTSNLGPQTQNCSGGPRRINTISNSQSRPGTTSFTTVLDSRMVFTSESPGWCPNDPPSDVKIVQGFPKQTCAVTLCGTRSPSARSPYLQTYPKFSMCYLQSTSVFVKRSYKWDPDLFTQPQTVSWFSRPLLTYHGVSLGRVGSCKVEHLQVICKKPTSTQHPSSE